MRHSYTIEIEAVQEIPSLFQTFKMEPVISITIWYLK